MTDDTGRTWRTSPRAVARAAAGRIPGWGADLDPEDRPSCPRERFDPAATAPTGSSPSGRRNCRVNARSSTAS